jgi:hypothetical protein
MALEDAGYYRTLAKKMLDQAQKAKDEEARKGFLDLAQSWRELADKIDALDKNPPRR